MAEYDQLTVATHRWIRKEPQLMDTVFQQGPLIAYAKQNLRRDFPGGREIDEPFWYNGLIGGAYSPGDEFDITEPQVEQSLQFRMKFWEVNVTLSKEQIQVLNKGPMQAFPIVKSRMYNAMESIGAHLELSMFLNGVNAPFTRNCNGLVEALNDNTTVSWDNALYPTYGTITRGGTVGTVLNSAPTNVNGSITLVTMENTYQDGSFGIIEPNLGVTTPKGYSAIKNKFQTQQRFVNTQDPKINFNGLQFNNATIMKSRYCPGSYLFGSNGTADPIAVTYITQTTKGAQTAYPAPVGGYPAAGTLWETLWWITAKKPFMNFYASDDPEYGFGFTGFKPAQGNTKVAGQVLFSGAFTWCPRNHRQLYGITG